MAGGKRKGGGEGAAQPRPLGPAGSGARLLCVRHEGLRAYALRHSGTVPVQYSKHYRISTVAADSVHILRIKLPPVVLSLI